MTTLLVSISAGMTSNLLFLAAFQFRLDMFLEPINPQFGRDLGRAVRSPAWDLAYVLSRQLRPRDPLVADLSTMAAAGYALAGGVARPSLPWRRRC